MILRFDSFDGEILLNLIFNLALKVRNVRAVNRRMGITMPLLCVHLLIVLLTLELIPNWHILPLAISSKYSFKVVQIPQLKFVSRKAVKFTVSYV